MTLVPSLAGPIRVQLPPAAMSPRVNEPVTVGIPLPRGFASDVGSLELWTDGHCYVTQSRALEHWPDGTIRWMLLDFQATAGVDRATHYTLHSGRAAQCSFEGGIKTSRAGDGIVIDTGSAMFMVKPGGAFPFDCAHAGHGAESGEVRSSLSVADQTGARCDVHVANVRIEETGPLRTVVSAQGRVSRAGGEPLLEMIGAVSFFAGSSTVRVSLTVKNPRPAQHAGGQWDLGDPSSVLLTDVVVSLTWPRHHGASTVESSVAHGEPIQQFDTPLELYQDSSGGENWRSSNHVNRQRVVPISFRGYRLHAAGVERDGLRATPIVVLRAGQRVLAATMPAFWQNFPKAIEATADTISLRLFPRQFADVYEIQGGEQKTHVFYLGVGEEHVSETPWDWCRAPALAYAEPEWYCTAEAIPYLIPATQDTNRAYLQLVSAAIEGENTFEHKREVIDEYGWRNFGDIYGDHEAVRQPGPSPLVSHYNNQYDAIGGLASQFMRTGDVRWWHHMDALAAHVADIDVYHTDGDKSAYNHGMFWHTLHYTDADTATHRTYPRSGLHGGGPASEHNYPAGLMLHYFMTGSLISRDAAIELARFVVNIDDGRKTVFRWLYDGYTGLASNSGSSAYHGPGRGGANSISALLVGHRLTGDARFLDKAEQLIRRCVHPADPLEDNSLLDAERKWFYTMFLQALGCYLDYKVELNALDQMYAYGRESLLHYARWMAAQEYPYLDKPEILEFPTETWAAQDMRKSEVFKYAAKHARGDERSRFLERSEFFFRYSTSTLAGMPTRTLARPVVILLTNGFMHAFFQQHSDVTAPPPVWTDSFGARELFVPQKTIALQRAASISALALAGLGAGLLWLVLR